MYFSFLFLFPMPSFLITFFSSHYLSSSGLGCDSGEDTLKPSVMFTDTDSDVSITLESNCFAAHHMYLDSIKYDFTSLISISIYITAL